MDVVQVIISTLYENGYFLIMCFLFGRGSSVDMQGSVGFQFSDLVTHFYFFLWVGQKEC